MGPITLTLAPQAASMRLPACVFVTRAEVLRGAAAAARTALRGLEELRRANSALPWLASTGGPAAANSHGVAAQYVHADDRFPCLSSARRSSSWSDFDRRQTTTPSPTQPLAA